MNLEEGQDVVRKIMKNPKLSKKGLSKQIIEKIEGDIGQTLKVMGDIGGLWDDRRSLLFEPKEPSKKHRIEEELKEEDEVFERA
jgi:hypothetical protein